MSKKVTIREVAERAGVSISSVHFALSGKPGVSDETRDRVRAAAQELGYQPNTVASSLKRRTQRIVILLPSEQGNNRYYYPQLWRGVHDYLSSVTINLECTELPYEDETEDEVFAELRRMAEAGEVDGILAVGHIDKDKITAKDWRNFEEAGISVVFINSLNRHSSYLCCVQPDYEIIGRTMAELVTSHIPEFGSILLCAGNPRWESHAMVVRGFESYLSERSLSNMIYKDFLWTIEADHYIRILREISRPDIAACCSVYSQGTILMARALEESGKAQRIFSVGSDLATDTANWIRHGVLNNSIQKNPYAQGYVGTRVLVDYLVNGKTPEEKMIYVGSEVVFASNLTMYEHGRYHKLFL